MLKVPECFPGFVLQFEMKLSDGLMRYFDAMLSDIADFSFAHYDRFLPDDRDLI